jgi:YcxB-like protein
MQIAFLLSPRELEDARKLFMQRTQSLNRRALSWLAVGAPLLLALMYLLADGINFFRHPGHAPDRFDQALVLVWLALAALSWYRRDQWFNPEPDYGKAQSFELEEDGIFRATEGDNKVRVPWTKISRYAETDEFFLLYSPWPWGTEKQSPRLGKQERPVLFILPKRAFEPGNVGRFGDLLQRKLSVWAKNPGLKADTVLSH